MPDDARRPAAGPSTPDAATTSAPQPSPRPARPRRKTPPKPPEPVVPESFTRADAAAQKLLRRAKAYEKDRCPRPGPLPSPAPRRRFAPGRALRALVGVDEDVIADYPQDRTRYTALGGVILGTSAMAAVSMWFAVRQTLHQPVAAAVVVAVVWGAFILNLDRWLSVSLPSLPVTKDPAERRRAWRRRLGMAAPRLVLAVMFSLVIAEPFVLQLFRDGIEREVTLTWRQEEQDLLSRLRACNPESPTTAWPPDCVARGERLNVQDTAAGTRTGVADLQQQIDAAQTSLDKDWATFQTLDTTARQECNGVPGTGLSGRPGEGPNCRRDRETADRFARDQHLAQRRADLDALKVTLHDAQASVSSTSDSYAAAVYKAVEQRLADVRSQHAPGSIGLQERMSALDRLSGRDQLVWLTALVLRLFFVAVECLPLLVKLMSTTGEYEKALAEAQARRRREVEAAYRVHSLPLRLRSLVAWHRWLAAKAALTTLVPGTASSAPAGSAATPPEDEDVIDLTAHADRRRAAR
jgi:hypothetical protein